MILDVLNRELPGLPKHASPRMVGEWAQSVVENVFKSGLTASIGQAVQKDFGLKDMEDVALTDPYGNYVAIDVKTHNKDKNSRPNVTSVERLAEFYRKDTFFFSLLLAKYRMSGDRPIFDEVQFFPVEHLHWNSLGLGALGKGQIQIATPQNIIVDTTQTRKQWMLELCAKLADFYPCEIERINDRIKYFDDTRIFWESK